MKRRQSLARTLVAATVLALIVGVAGVFTGYLSWPWTSTAAPPVPPTTPPVPPATPPVPPAVGDGPSYLALVNTAHPVASTPARTTGPAWPTVAVRDTTIQLETATLAAVSSLFHAARAAGGGEFFVASGYRTATEQQQVYNEAADKSFVQLPGHSEHETGLAADIMATGISQTDLAASPEGRWLAANAWRFGLILRYPAGKESVTGIAYEPWHFRYVGQPHASYCHAHGLTLEEYIDFLHQWGGYETTVDGTAYKVRYERDDAPPAGDRTTVSADNTGGYIVTTW